MRALLLTLALIITPAITMAAEDIKTVCTHGNKTRIIEVVYTGADVVPCEVRYTKEEGSKTLWTASNKTGFCESKAEAFVEKQQGWGWSCAPAEADTGAETDIESSTDAGIESGTDTSADTEAQVTTPHDDTTSS